jgi:hypothetical protein
MTKKKEKEYLKEENGYQANRRQERRKACCGEETIKIIFGDTHLQID